MLRLPGKFADLVRRSFPEQTVAVECLKSNGELVVVTKGERGYRPTGHAGTPEGEDAINAALGMDKMTAARIIIHSMRGPDVWEGLAECDECGKDFPDDGGKTCIECDIRRSI